MTSPERIAFVTGGASGIGLAIAERLGRDGLAVAIADVDESGASAAADKIEADGGSAFSLRCDVADLDQVRQSIGATVERFGGLDVLVSNAGFDEPGFFLQSDPSRWQRVLDVNLVGVLNCTFAAAPELARRSAETGYARIVNIASDAGRVGSLGEAVYSAAKGGVIAFTKAMARELARDRITVNAICPGPADTPMTDAIRQTEIGAKLMDRMIAATPLKRLVRADEVAGAVAYFVGEDAAFATAQVLSLSGGLTIPG
ncbi:MAG: SDR family NAD(P)-dependent oxidoreductase [Actinomycetota bacterium]